VAARVAAQSRSGGGGGEGGGVDGEPEGRTGGRHAPDPWVEGLVSEGGLAGASVQRQGCHGGARKEGSGWRLPPTTNS